MKYLSVLLIMLFATLGVQAQEDDDQEFHRLTISGLLLDADLKEPMVQATVQLFTASDSIFVGGTVSNNKGVFSVEAPSNGTYKLRISSVGYQTLQREVTLRRYQNVELGRLLLSPESIMHMLRNSPCVTFFSG